MNGHRKSIVRLLVVFMVFAALNSALPANAAAAAWDCTFGPAAGGEAPRLPFLARHGIGNDSMSLFASGRCANRPVCPPNCQFENVAASITASITEVPGGNYLHFGNCDIDPWQRDYRELELVFDLEIRRQTHPAIHRVVQVAPTYYLGRLVDPFPGTYLHSATMYEYGDPQFHGGFRIQTRIAGVCPPHGTDTAAIYGFTFTEL